MTAVMEPQLTLQEQHPEAFAEMLREQERFDATRTPCPSWCNDECETIGHFGTAVMHISDDTDTPTESSYAGHDSGSLLIRSIRYEQLDCPSESQVSIHLDAAEGAFDDSAEFTPAQARLFAAQLLRHADLLEPEQDLPAEDVRVGDWFPVDGEWLWVYGVDCDEPSDTVRISVTVDRDELPEVGHGQDEEPHEFGFGDTVRIRREVTQ